MGKKIGNYSAALLLFLIGLLFMDESGKIITGAFLGILLGFSSSLGIILWMIAGIIFIASEGDNLEERIKTHWKKFPINRHSMLEDIEQEYLSRKQQQQRSPLQQLIEKTVAKGKLIEEENQNKKQVTTNSSMKVMRHKVEESLM